MRGDEYDDETVDVAPETEPDWFPGNHLPEDARRLGLTHHVPDGALLDFAGSLDGAKAYHRFTAWFLLVVFGLPVLFAVMRLFQAL
ncbi:hypothetical protein DJ010_16690 [Nocardioides silvaticus]|uniref:Uncharacterized protein n=1 Tax=Nocardioides silvaticus TaxID=2201891 RepID=A0A316TD18_9ACTN|nr:hypothetical protein [Nocardioides silvaticus]PWN01678.1 hypothetical protein DJ010_16690 [Nocardioides silvaticus]